MSNAHIHIPYTTTTMQCIVSSFFLQPVVVCSHQFILFESNSSLKFHSQSFSRFSGIQLFSIQKANNSGIPCFTRNRSKLKNGYGYWIMINAKALNIIIIIILPSLQLKKGERKRKNKGHQAWSMINIIITNWAYLFRWKIIYLLLLRSCFQVSQFSWWKI